MDSIFSQIDLQTQTHGEGNKGTTYPHGYTEIQGMFQLLALLWVYTMTTALCVCGKIHPNTEHTLQQCNELNCSQAVKI